MYFFVKYSVDKYNVYHVFPPEYDGQGRIHKKIMNFTYISMIISQSSMFIILVLVFGSDYIPSCFVIAGSQILWMILDKLNSLTNFTDLKKKSLSKGFMTVEEEEEFVKSFKTRNRFIQTKKMSDV